MERIATALEEGRSLTEPRRKSKPNHNGSADVVSLYPGVTSMIPPPIYERDLTPDEREIIDLYRRMPEGQQDSFMLAGRGLADPHIAERISRFFDPDSAPDDGPIAG